MNFFLKIFNFFLGRSRVHTCSTHPRSCVPTRSLYSESDLWCMCSRLHRCVAARSPSMLSPELVCTFFAIILCCAYYIVRGGTTSKKGHQKGHKWPFSVCVNLKKDPNRHLRPRTNMHSIIWFFFFFFKTWTIQRNAVDADWLLLYLSL